MARCPRRRGRSPSSGSTHSATPSAAPRQERPAPAAGIGPSRPGASRDDRPAPYARPEGRGGGRGDGGDRGGGGKGGGGKGDGKGGKGNKPPHIVKYEAAKAAGLGIFGSGKLTGGSTQTTRDVWKDRRI